MYTLYLLPILMMTNFGFSEEHMPIGTYPVDVSETLKRHMRKSQPNVSDEEIAKRIDLVKDGFSEQLSSYRVRDGGVDVLNGKGESFCFYSAGKINYNEKLAVVLVLDPDEPWRNSTISIKVILEGDRIIWNETIDGQDRVIVLHNTAKPKNVRP